MHKRRRLRHHFIEHQHHYKLATDLTIAVMGGWLAEAIPHFISAYVLHLGGFLT